MKKLKEGYLMFSFVVPVYNTSNYLDKCMESLLLQKGAEFEIILVDDGSTDNSGDICDTYAQMYTDIVRVIHKKNEGSLLARQTGIINAKGDWILCIDSDDYVDNNYLWKIIQTIDKYDPDLVMFHYSYFSENIINPATPMLPNDTVFDSNNKGFIYEKALTGNSINSMCLKAIKRCLIDVNIDYHNCGIFCMCDDVIQVLPLITRAKRIVYLNEVLYYYRKGHNSTTKRQDWERWRSSKECFLQTEKYLNIWKVSIELQKKFYTHQLELLSNFLRGVFCQIIIDLPHPPEEIVHNIINHTAFQRAEKMYDNKYSQTKYNKLCVPIILHYLKDENIIGLRRFFSLENKVLSRR